MDIACCGVVVLIEPRRNTFRNMFLERAVQSYRLLVEGNADQESSRPRADLECDVTHRSKDNRSANDPEKDL